MQEAKVEKPRELEYERVQLAQRTEKDIWSGALPAAAEGQGASPLHPDLIKLLVENDMEACVSKLEAAEIDNIWKGPLTEPLVAVKGQC